MKARFSLLCPSAIFRYRKIPTAQETTKPNFRFSLLSSQVPLIPSPSHSRRIRLRIRRLVFSAGRQRIVPRVSRIVCRRDARASDMAERKRQEIEEEVASPAKKQKLESKDRNDKDGAIDLISSWSNFEVKRVLNNNVVRKQIWLEGSFKGHENAAIVLLEKKCFPEELVFLNNFFNKETLLKNVFDNDAYGSYECFPAREHNGRGAGPELLVKLRRRWSAHGNGRKYAVTPAAAQLHEKRLNTTVIYPATQKHLDKFTKKEIHLVEETPELYKTVTLPRVIGQQFSLQWVENILNHKAEADRIIYEDLDEQKGFVLIPDLKWDGNVNTLNVLAISRQKIKCIRELNESHLPLLRNIKDAGVAAIVKKYDVPASRLRVFFHYLPSYYHLHVHFTQLSVEDAGIYAEKAHLLSSVISNIEIMPDYYQKATLTFAVFNPDLVEDYREPATLATIASLATFAKSDEPEEEC